MATDRNTYVHCTKDRTDRATAVGIPEHSGSEGKLDFSIGSSRRRSESAPRLVRLSGAARMRAGSASANLKLFGATDKDGFQMTRTWPPTISRYESAPETMLSTTCVWKGRLAATSGVPEVTCRYWSTVILGQSK